jgi:hypothetical protein
MKYDYKNQPKRSIAKRYFNDDNNSTPSSRIQSQRTDVVYPKKGDISREKITQNLTSHKMGEKLVFKTENPRL